MLTIVVIHYLIVLAKYLRTEKLVTSCKLNSSGPNVLLPCLNLPTSLTSIQDRVKQFRDLSWGKIYKCSAKEHKELNTLLKIIFIYPLIISMLHLVKCLPDLLVISCFMLYSLDNCVFSQQMIKEFYYYLIFCLNRERW